MIRCSKCGTINEADATFCIQCDAFLEWSGERVDAEGQPLATPQPQAHDAGRPPLESPAAGTPQVAAPPPAAGAATGAPPARPPSRPEPKAGASAPAKAADQPDSRRPEKGTEPQRKAKPPTVTMPEKPKPGEFLCPTCGTGNDPGRKFCRRCGNALGLVPAAAAPVPASAASPPPAKGTSWFSRVRRRGRQEIYMAGHRPESMLSARGRWRPGSASMMFGFLAILGLGGIASYLYMPQVREGIDEVVAMVSRQFEQRQRVNVVSAEGRSAPGFPALNMTDGFTNTYWVALPGPDGRWWADLELERTSDLRQINFDGGADGEEYERLGRPFRIQVRAGSQSSPIVELSDTKDQQPVDIDLRGVKKVRLIVHSQYRGDDTEDQVAIRRVTFFEPK